MNMQDNHSVPVGFLWIQSEPVGDRRVTKVSSIEGCSCQLQTWKHGIEVVSL
jgi:hypothetical protein